MLFSAEAPAAAGYFQIEVVDAETGRGVPLVELETVNAVRYYTDSAGRVAFYEPGLMNRQVFFSVRSHGYEYPADGFGMRGKALNTVPGSRSQLRLKRVNIAERLYRLTGAGIYRDTALLGLPSPIRQPLLNGQVVGQDSVFTIVYSGKLYWFWGDTSRPGYPLGNFHMSGATSQLPGQGGLDPGVGVDLEYFVDDKGFSRGMAPMPGDGPTWADAFVILPEAGGRRRMYCAYAKIRGSNMEVHARGLAVFDDEKQVFEQAKDLPMNAPIYPGGHAFEHQEKGNRYVYFATALPLTRVRATSADYCRLEAYEAFTCLKPGSRLADREIDRAADGTVRYSWKTNTSAVSHAEQIKLVKAGKLKPEEAFIQLQEADSGKSFQAHNGSVYWNEHRRRWVLIVCEQFGTSMLGETWFAEAGTPLGPWVYARKVVTHERYTFYNPKQHPMFDQDSGRVVYFEGTYANTFSGNPVRTPFYDYNQVMYRLDLEDPRLILPVPVYRVQPQGGGTTWATAVQARAESGDKQVAFFAWDRPGKGAVPIQAWTNDGGSLTLVVGPTEGLKAAAAAAPLFFALPADAPSPPATTTPLFEHVSSDGKRREYLPGSESKLAGFQRSAKPLCLVWRNPLSRSLSTQLAAELRKP